jgi:hypothetical protein
MSEKTPRSYYHSNRYNAQDACKHCNGAIRHARWCITVNREVFYAFEIVSDSTALTVGDSLILHSLGAAWVGSKQ